MKKGISNFSNLVANFCLPISSRIVLLCFVGFNFMLCVLLDPDFVVLVLLWLSRLYFFIVSVFLYNRYKITVARIIHNEGPIDTQMLCCLVSPTV